MRTLLFALLVALAAAAGAVAWSFRAAPLPVDGDFVLKIPAAQPPEAMKLAVLPTGRIASKAGLAYRGGALGEERQFGMAPVLVQHPRGNVLIDAGLGRNAAQHWQRQPRLQRAMSDCVLETPAADLLQAAGLAPAQLTGVLLTHAHWDHVSGLEDLPGVPVLLPQAELDFIGSGHRMARLAASLGALNYRVYEFADGPYLGFETSHDLFKDGSVVVVPAPGHTPGSVVVFVTPPGDAREAFVGDLMWQREGIELPAERPWLTRRIADVEPPLVRRWIVHLHRLQRAMPDLVVVPAHDLRPIAALPRLAPASGAPS
jgi:N-acyl homoserine lactone hydrolase